MFFHNPLGLLALLGIPLLIFLHKYVLAGERRDVSNLALWQDTERLRTEGAVRRKLPRTLVLLLEILALIALALAIAGLDVRSESAYRHVGVVVDSSASMSGGQRSPASEWLQRLRELDAADVRFSVVESGKRPNLLGGKPLAYNELTRYADAIKFDKPFHSMVPSLELLTMAGVQPLHQLVISDRDDVQHGRLLQVGDQQSNIGIVAAHWNSGGNPFFVVKRFADGQQVAARLLSYNSQDALVKQQPSAVEDVVLNLQAAEETPLNLPVADEAVAVRLVLQEDTHAVDNQVLLMRPNPRTLSLRVLHDNEQVQRSILKLKRVLPQLREVNDASADITITDAIYALRNGVGVAILNTGTTSQLRTGLVLDAFHPLLTGIDVGGLVWYAHQTKLPDDVRVLLSSRDGTPLIWLQRNVLVINVDVGRSNVLQHSLFPILMQNLVEWRNQQKGGVVRNNYRLGEALSVAPAADWSDTSVSMIAPDQTQRTLAFNNGTGMLTYGDLELAGLYQLKVGEEIYPISVNLLDGEEGELRYRKESDVMPEMEFGALAQNTEYSWIRWILMLIALLCLMLAWVLLRRTK